MRSEKKNPPKSNHAIWQNAIYCAACLLVVGVFAWSAQPGVLESAGLRPENSYYNLLVQGFQAGQLNVKREPSPELAKLADPYDPVANEPYVWDPHHLSYEMTYCHRKLYLYFGVTPALVLFWPYAELTGHYLLHEQAVVLFFSLGFLIAAGLLHAIWRRYFPEAGVWTAIAGVLALGLVTGILETLSSCDVYEVAKSCAFAFTMLALAALWRALHAPKTPVVWLLLASTAYGLAVGSRPSILFGAIILLVPLAQAWHSSNRISPHQLGWLLVAAIGPILLIGLGLMLYNFLRFGSPFEFGWHYQLTNYNNSLARQFSFGYLPGNFRFYFLQPVRWNTHFPFLEAAAMPSSPSGFYGFGSPDSGILINYPVVWLALAAPLAWKGQSSKEASRLRWFIIAATLLFTICAATLCFFFAGGSSYELDFLPALMLLAVIGIFSLERALIRSSLIWQRVARAGWCLLLAYSIVFNLLASVDAHAEADYLDGNSLLNQGRTVEAFEKLQRAIVLKPYSASFHVGLGKAYYKNGQPEETIKQLQEAIEIKPRFAEAEYDLGDCLLQSGQAPEAFAHLQKALEIDRGYVESCDPVENNNLAWLLATDPEPANRNGSLAVILAEAACQRTHFQTTAMVGTLAAAYAQSGRFNDAITMAQKAILLAKQNSETDLEQKNRDMLGWYQKHMAYHESRTH